MIMRFNFTKIYMGDFFYNVYGIFEIVSLNRPVDLGLHYIECTAYIIIVKLCHIDTHLNEVSLVH